MKSSGDAWGIGDWPLEAQELRMMSEGAERPRHTRSANRAGFATRDGGDHGQDASATKRAANWVNAGIHLWQVGVY